MANTIKSYPLSADRNVINMPYDAKPIAARDVSGAPTLWALINPSSPMTDRVFVILTEDQSVGDGWLNYVGSYKVEGAEDVRHVFERDPGAVDG